MIETIERITVEDNACSKKTSKEVTVKRKPGASPLLFGAYLMDHCAFIGLEDISDGLPSYREDVVGIGESAQNVWRSLGQSRPESPARGTEELELALPPQFRTSVPGVSEDNPVSGVGEEYPQPSSNRLDAEQLSLF